MKKRKKKHRPRKHNQQHTGKVAYMNSGRIKSTLQTMRRRRMS
ncbi:hypothetical protein [Pontiella sulfatireligans]|uniref:Uncharacterized protein n=1 Tax=Pontiella sulfatireligans TaxID=2750658 RepID=A0A6C2URY4_9BACT|nr:hypothetical protein [Pontiella sulfatireligans]VGO22713.1 hypothetical protein SCARR_04809 [Pontiella sulfatireligans]